VEYLEMMWDTEVADPTVVREAIDEIPPDSTVWRWRSNNSWRMAGLLRAVFSTASRPDDHLDYAFSFADAFGGYFGLWDRARWENDMAFADAVYERMRERIPDGRFTKWIALQEVVQGSEAPDFSVPSVDDPSVRFTNADFRGSVYLIDFWATWCMPCVQAMPRLHQLHDQYRSRGFKILAYSFDSGEETVCRFRAERWPMPWPNSIEPEKGFESDIAKAFRLELVPYLVLVGRDGKILEAGEDFSVEELAARLSQLLGKPEGDR